MKSVAFAIVVLFGVVAALVSCGRAISGPPQYHPRTYYPPKGLGLIESDGLPVRYVPFVEGIDVPDEVYEGESFQIVIRVSAEFRPAVLLGYPHWHQRGRFSETQSRDEFLIRRIPEGEQPQFYHILHVDVTLFNPPAIGPPIDRFVFDVPGLPAGQHLLRFNTTSKREFGGVGAIAAPGYHKGDSEFFTEVKAVEIPITVLPTEGGGEQE